MDKSNKILFGVLFTLLFLSVYSYSSSDNVKDDYMNDKWHFSFRNCNLGSALKMIEEKTGVEFFTNGYTGNNILNKDFKEKTVEEVINDILKETNYSVLWRYSDNTLISAGIWIFDNNANPGAFRNRKEIVKSKISSEIKAVEKESLSKSDIKETNNIERNIAVTGSKKLFNQYAPKVSKEYRFLAKNQSISKRKTNRSGVHSRDRKIKSVAKNSSFGKINTYPEIPPIPEKFKNLEAPPMPPGLDYKEEF